MSATTTGIASPGPAPVEHRRFLRVLHAEWTKFRTLRGWVVAVLLAGVLMDLVGLFAAGNATVSCGNGGPAQTGSACQSAVPTGPGGQAVTDSFYFAHEPLAREGSITVEVTALTGRYTTSNVGRPGQNPLASMSAGVQPWSKAGIMIKASTAPGSAYAAMMVTGGHGVRMQDDYTDDTPGLPGTVSLSSPHWLRLTRTGDTVTGYDSLDGARWTRVGTARLAGLPATVQVGLFAASPGYTKTASFLGGSSSTGGPSLATGTFDHLDTSGTKPSATPSTAAGAAWTGTIIGGTGGSGPSLTGSEGFQRAGGQYTVTGSGDIVPVVPGAGAGGSVATISDHLLGAFAGLVVLVVIATMFITGEYRRGLIRTTLAATPHRGRVLAAKAIVIGGVTFLIGLAASLVAVTVGVHLSRDQGQYVLPVSWLTEARVIAGTAALLAVAAVLALAMGAMVRRSAAAVAAVIVGIVLPWILGTAQVLPLGASEWLLRVTPAAGFAIQQSIPRYPQVTAAYTPPAYLPLSPWAGFAVLCGYAAAAVAVALWLLRRRDA
jgi:ABC-type transport system involved in multi-copper enzyme maturation permease subunit